jgi:hypothetical protein
LYYPNTFTSPVGTNLGKVSPRITVADTARERVGTRIRKTLQVPRSDAAVRRVAPPPRIAVRGSRKPGTAAGRLAFSESVSGYRWEALMSHARRDILIAGVAVAALAGGMAGAAAQTRPPPEIP